MIKRTPSEIGKEIVTHFPYFDTKPKHQGKFEDRGTGVASYQGDSKRFHDFCQIGALLTEEAQCMKHLSELSARLASRLVGGLSRGTTPNGSMRLTGLGKSPHRTTADEQKTLGPMRDWLTANPRKFYGVLKDTLYDDEKRWGFNVATRNSGRAGRRGCHRRWGATGRRRAGEAGAGRCRSGVAAIPVCSGAAPFMVAFVRTTLASSGWPTKSNAWARLRLGRACCVQRMRLLIWQAALEAAHTVHFRMDVTGWRRLAEPDIKCRVCYHCAYFVRLEKLMEVAIRKMGNSQGVLIPKPILAQVGLEGSADLQVRDGVIEIRPIRRNPREGWAEDAQRLAEQGADVLVWPELANEGDEALVW